LHCSIISWSGCLPDDAPAQLAQTDLALYRQLREQITQFFLRGGDTFSLKKLETLAWN